jgi:protein-arginine kinase activator protein McsA
MKALAKRKPKKIEYVYCPTCGRGHSLHHEFGRFCCASCLQTVIRPLIVALIKP